MDFRFKATLSLIRPLSRIMDSVQWDFSSVTALSFPITSDIGFIVTAFPNLQAFSFEAPLNRRLSSIDGLSDLASILGPQLAYIQICKMRWDVIDFQEVQAIFPQISRLTMGGTMAFGGSPVRPRWDLQVCYYCILYLSHYRSHEHPADQFRTLVSNWTPGAYGQPQGSCTQ